MSEDDTVQLDEAFIASLLSGNNSLTKKEAEQRAAALRAKKWTSASSAFEDGVTPYPGLQMEEARPVAELRVLCHSPLLTFFYFMPKSLRVTITEETNEYNKQQLDQRAEAILAKQGIRVSGRPRKTLAQIRRRLKSSPLYETHKILHVVGLLIARMRCPQRRRFADHWSMTEDGAIPAGTFGRFMGRNRCQSILRDLHFVDNKATRTRDEL
ncbi:hypothetical protein PHYSODRAFT_499128 [Phytophthora sojae]|uniref:PiggyBac transposable element-derived protein domain-containing protein n=1 Tax=Phytophthora sojae (strain P6497) TaxID=1094619 RepID=G4ZFQ6_PHYSP|nr:hypothetical protein PHYSODRAFT_499128 [Phytophthora sojae]EGZ18524.1 hypothetical protein PHYSODRAFT_499128 [Phytophthora sojae]|eukprot:XP_009527582.1 hypothetical protein PHYSODRAFT_499128 [Phytophthora sojae]